MTLASALIQTSAAVRAALPPTVAVAIARSIADQTASGQAGRAVGTGDLIALPILTGLDGEPFDLLAHTAGRPAVLMFLRGGWCPYCNTTLRAYADALPAIQAAGGLLLAITPERPNHAAAMAAAQAPGLALAVDTGSRFAASLGLAFALPEALRPGYREIGIDLEARNQDGAPLLPIPAIYVLAPCGRVNFAHVDADFTERAEPSDVIAALERLASAPAEADVAQAA